MKRERTAKLSPREPKKGDQIMEFKITESLKLNQEMLDQVSSREVVSTSLSIRKRDQREFVRAFSDSNQFRPMELGEDAIHEEISGASSLYLLGLQYKTLPFGQELGVFATKANDPCIGFQVASVQLPRAMVVTKDAGGKNSELSVRGSDGKEIVLKLHGDLSPEVRREVSAKIGYALYERDSFMPDGDYEHWGEAEKIGRDVGEMIANCLI
jgi:hypothetical protein